MTPAIRYRIRLADSDDVSDLLELRRHAEWWLNAAGIEQWTDPTVGDDAIQHHVQSGNTYVVTTFAGDIVACLTLAEADTDFWTDSEANQAAKYLYKFIIRSDRRGKQLGDALLDWACERAQKDGAQWLRLDCWKTNTRLHDYYLRRGFRHVDTRSASGRNSGALFERPTDLRLSGALNFELIDETSGEAYRLPPMDRYDPLGEAAVWQQAADEVQKILDQGTPDGDLVDPWSDALRKVITRLSVRATQIRQANGMYYRVIGK